MGEKLLMTMTGEIFQPIRVYYELSDKEMVIKAFLKLQCMDFDSRKDRWIWLYEGEAKRLKFHKPYSSIPKEMHPLVLGSFYFRENNHMLLDLRSFERAIAGVKFFNKHIKRNMAKVIDVAVVNKLFTDPGDYHISYDVLFDPEKVVYRNQDEALSKLEPLKAIDNLEERFRMAISFMEEDAKKPLPEVERFPTYFYEEGILGLQNKLMIRQGIAFEHWKGNKDYSFLDMLKKVFNYSPIE